MVEKKSKLKQAVIVIATFIVGGASTVASQYGIEKLNQPEAKEEDNFVEPFASIEGPDESDAGRLVVLYGDDSIGTTLDWDIYGLPHGEDFHVSEGNLIFVADRECTVTCRLSASSCLNGVPVISKAEKKVVISGGVNVPETPSDPTPDDPPVSRGDLEKLSYSEGMKLSSSDKSHADEISDVYKSVGRMNLGDLQSYADETLKRIKSVLGGSVGGWSGWYASITGKLSDMERNAELNDQERIQSAWSDIASGLEDVK